MLSLYTLLFYPSISFLDERLFCKSDNYYVFHTMLLDISCERCHYICSWTYTHFVVVASLHNRRYVDI
jgi:hypothetical protein